MAWQGTMNISAGSPASIFRLKTLKKDVSARPMSRLALTVLPSVSKKSWLSTMPVVRVASLTPGTYCLNPGATPPLTLKYSSAFPWRTELVLIR